MSLKRGTPEYAARQKMLAARRTRQFERSLISPPKLPVGKYIPAGAFSKVAGTTVRNKLQAEQMNRMHDKWLKANQHRFNH